MDERWLPVVGYEGLYEVSDLGRVKSVRPKARARADILSVWWTPNQQYLTVGLYRDGKYRRVRVHTLVAAAFLGPRPDGQEVRHLDGDPTNPALDNLAYGTRSQNMFDKVAHGRDHNATKTHCPQGHAYDGENTYWFLNRRQCKRCHREANRRYDQKRKRRRAQGSVS